MNCLVHVLDEVCKENGGNMPPTLYLQADNSTKDNKNAFLMMFLAWLVKNKVFKKVKLSFLMVGHTHEDIDQVFSRISSGMAKQDAHTLPQLLGAIEGFTTPQPKVKHLKSIYDYRGMLLSSRGLFEGIMQPHHFKIEERETKIILSYKDWPREEEEYRCLDVTSFVTSLENPSPVEVNAKIDEPLTRMAQDLSKWADSGRLQVEEVVWWRSYLGSCKRDARLRPDISRLTDLGKYRLPDVQEEGDLGNLLQAVQRNKEREARKSVLKLKRR